MTAQSIGKTITIQLDGEVLMSPTVNEAIYGGDVMVTGSYIIPSCEGPRSRPDVQRAPATSVHFHDRELTFSSYAQLSGSNGIQTNYPSGQMMFGGALA